MFDVHAVETIENQNGVATIKGVETLFSNVISLAIPFSGIALFIMLLIGGFNYLSAGADAGKAQAAQKTITYAIMGLVFIAVSFLILRLIGEFTGVKGFFIFQVFQS